MKKLSSKKKILQILMLNKKIQKIKLKKNKRVKDKKKADERERELPRNITPLGIELDPTTGADLSSADKK